MVCLHYTLYVLLLWLCPGFSAGTECNVSSYGKEFVFGFVDLPSYDANGQPVDPTVSILLITQTSANVSIALPSTNSASKTPTTVTLKYFVSKSKRIQFNSTFINKQTNQSQSSGGLIKITSDAPVSVIKKYGQYSVCPVLPSTADSSSYVIPSYDVNQNSYSQAQLFVAAINDSTTVRLEGFKTGSMVKTLKQNEIFMYNSLDDLSSTTITSNNKIIIFSSVTVGTFSRYPKLQNHFIMQAPPVDGHAKHFIIPSILNLSSNKRKIRIYAPFQNANIEIHATSDTTKYVTVYQKIFYEFVTSPATVLEILSDGPLVVVQIALDSRSRAVFTTSIPAVSQFLTSYPVTSLGSGQRNFEVIIQHKMASGLLVDGKPILHNPDQQQSGLPQPATLGNYIVLTIQLPTSPATISHIASEPFGLFYRNSDYFFPAGMQFTNSDCPSVNPSADPSIDFVGRK